MLEAVRAAASAREEAWAASLGEAYDGAAALARLRGITGVSQ